MQGTILRGSGLLSYTKDTHTVPALLISPSSDGNVQANNNGICQGSQAETQVVFSENEKNLFAYSNDSI